MWTAPLSLLAPASDSPGAMSMKFRPCRKGAVSLRGLHFFLACVVAGFKHALPRSLEYCSLSRIGGRCWRMTMMSIVVSSTSTDAFSTSADIGHLPHCIERRVLQHSGWPETTLHLFDPAVRVVYHIIRTVREILCRPRFLPDRPRHLFDNSCA